jgi:hypothetical protein
MSTCLHCIGSVRLKYGNSHLNSLTGQYMFVILIFFDGQYINGGRPGQPDEKRR